MSVATIEPDRHRLHQRHGQPLVTRCQHEQVAGGERPSRVRHVSQQSEAVAQAQLRVELTDLRLTRTTVPRRRSEPGGRHRARGARPEEIRVPLLSTEVRDRSDQDLVESDAQFPAHRIAVGAEPRSARGGRHGRSRVRPRALGGRPSQTPSRPGSLRRSARTSGGSTTGWVRRSRTTGDAPCTPRAVELGEGAAGRRSARTRRRRASGRGGCRPGPRRVGPP